VVACHVEKHPGVEDPTVHFLGHKRSLLLCGLLINSTSPLGGWPRLFDLAGITNTVGTPFLCVFCEKPALRLSKGRESEMPAPSGFDHVSTTKSNSTRSIATHPFDKLRAGLAKNARMRQPRWEWCKQRSLKVGHPPATWRSRGHVSLSVHSAGAFCAPGICSLHSRSPKGRRLRGGNPGKPGDRRNVPQFFVRKNGKRPVCPWFFPWFFPGFSISRIYLAWFA